MSLALLLAALYEYVFWRLHQITMETANTFRINMVIFMLCYNIICIWWIIMQMKSRGQKGQNSGRWVYKSSQALYSPHIICLKLSSLEMVSIIIVPWVLVN